MRKINHITAIAMLLLALIGWCSPAANAELRKVYYIGDYNEWCAPTESNQTYLDTQKSYLLETAEGSNIYEGTIYDRRYAGQDYSYFRLFTELAPASCLDYWNVNCLRPTENYEENPIDISTGAFITLVKKQTDYRDGNFNWAITNPNHRGLCMHLDMNTMTLKVVIEDALWMLLNTDEVPTAADYAGYRNVRDDAKYYVPAGALKFRFYDPWRECLVSKLGMENASTSYIWLSDLTQTDDFISIGSWPGGTVNITSSRISFSTTPTSVTLGENMLISTGSDIAMPTADNYGYVHDSFTTLQNSGNGLYTATMSLQTGDKLRIISALGSGSTQASVICPGETDRRLNIVDGEGFSTYVTKPYSEAGYWTVNIDKRRNVTVTLDTNGDHPMLKLEYEDEGDFIYLVGNMTGWVEPSAANAEHYQQWRLFSTTDGAYYGAFNISGYENAIFRFYSDLTGWDGNASLGCRWEDSPIYYDFTDNMHLPLVVPGKGAYCINDWPGGMMYMKVYPAEGYVIFSSSEIDHEFGTTASPSSIYAYSENNNSFKLAKTSEGVYEGIVQDKNLPGESWRFYTKDGPFSEGDELKKGTNAISAPSEDYLLKVNDLGVASATFTVQEGINTTPANAFRFDATEYATASDIYYVKIDLNTGKIYSFDGSHSFIGGELAGGKMPTVENIEEFRSLAVDNISGARLEIPAGKFNFTLVNPASTAQGSEQELTFIGNNVRATTWSGGFYNCHITCPDWKDGTAVITPRHIARLEDVTAIYASYYGEDGYTKYVKLKPVSEESKVFKGKVFIPAPEYTSRYGMQNYIGLYLDNIFDATDYLNTPGDMSVGCALYFYPYYMENFRDQSERRVDFDSNGSSNRNIYFGGSSFNVSQLANSWVEVTVDLENMKVGFDVTPSALHDYYVINTDREIKEITGAALYDYGTPGIFEYLFQTPYNTGKFAWSFNLTDRYGNTLAPAEGDAEVEFDIYGFSKNSYTAKEPGTNAGKWGVATNGILSSDYEKLILDPSEKTITVISSDNSKCYFPMFFIGDYETMDFSIEEAVSMAIIPVDENTLEGHCYIPEAAKNLYFSMSPIFETDYTVRPRYADESVLNVGEDGSESVYKISIGERNLGGYESRRWNVENVTGKWLKFRIDKLNGTMTVSWDREYTGMEYLAADNDIRVGSGNGFITITTSQTALIDIFNIQGMHLRTVKAEAGVTTVNLAPGIYIASGHKVMVR